MRKIRAHVHTYAHTRTRTHAHVHAHTHTHTRTRTRTRIRTHAHAHTHTRTHTYTRIGARVRARENFSVGVKGMAGAFRFAFLCAHTCVCGGACAHRCACGGGWGAIAPVVLSAGGRAGFYIYTAYTNRYAIYRLRRTSYAVSLT